MHRFAVAGVIFFIAICFGQTQTSRAGNWIVQVAKDAFTDEATSAIAIGEWGETPLNFEPMFVVNCQRGRVSSFTVEFDEYMSSGAFITFLYRVNEGEIKSASGFTTDVALFMARSESGFESVAADVLRDGATVAFRVPDFEKVDHTIIFDLTGLAAALGAAGCAL